MKDQVDQIRAFNRFYTNFIGLLNERLLGSSVSLTEGRILYEIARRPGCMAKYLMEILRIDRGYLSRALSRLERANFLVRSPSEMDGRARILHLTPKGKKLLDGIDRDADLQIEGILGALGRPERKRLVSAMREIETILSQSEYIDQPIS